MDLLAGAYVVVALVVAVGGAAKLVSPRAFADTLRSLGVPGGTVAARVSGAAEVVVGIGCVVLGGRWAAVVLAVLYLAFAVVVAAARRAGAASCGCFGAAGAPPGGIHLGVNLASAAVAGLAVLQPVAPVADQLTSSGGWALPWAAGVVLAVWLVVVLDTTGAALAGSVRDTGAVRQQLRSVGEG